MKIYTKYRECLNKLLNYMNNPPFSNIFKIIQRFTLYAIGPSHNFATLRIWEKVKMTVNNHFNVKYIPFKKY